jgi:hypothetical protein
MVREVRSPWSRERSGPSPERRVGTSPWSSNARADWGHVAHNLGKGGHRPVSARRDNAPPVLGSGFQSPFDPRDPTR